MSFSVGAKERTKQETCESLLKGTTVFGTLEEICGFNGGVADIILSAYKKENCEKISLKKSTMEEFKTELIKEISMGVEVYGQEGFCEKKIEFYHETMKSMQKNNIQPR